MLHKENLKEEITQEYDDDEIVLNIMDDIEDLEKKHAKLLCTDLQLETSYQLLLQFLLLFLSMTNTATTKGLESMFRKASLAVLIISILWSMRSSSSHAIKVIALQKGHFPMVSKLLMVVFAFFATATKLIANLSFFIPSFGLFDLLHHWEAEQIPFFASKSGKLNASNGDLLYLFNTTPVPWALVDRWNYQDQEFPPHYDLYTGMSLAWTFNIFLLLNAVHTLAIFIAKYITSPSFRKANIVKKIVNSMETSHVPLPFEDWDNEGGSILEHKQRRKEVVGEVLSVIAVNKLLSLFMFVPLTYTGEYPDQEI